MQQFDFSLLDFDSTIRDLPGFHAEIHPDAEGQAAMDLFTSQVNLPGILIMDGGVFSGFISRKMFYEHTGKRFGIEVYLRRPITYLLEQELPAPLLLQTGTKLSHAVKEVLSRNEVEVYEPIVEFSDDRTYRIIPTLTLFTAQNQILVSLHNQRVYGLTSHLPIDDECAINKFLKLAGITPGEDLTKYKKIYTIHCPKCDQRVQYNISEVVRSFPSLHQGIEITDKMGSRMYLFYVRHTCGEEVIDLPVQHDDNLEYRAIKTPRLVETYA